MSITRTAIGAMIGLPLLAAISVGQAAPVQINAMADLESNDYFSWGENLGDSCTQQCAQTCLPFVGCFGPLICPITSYNYGSSPFSATSAGGFEATVTNTDSLVPTDPFRRVDEGTVLCTGWEGNFTIGDKLLFTTLASGGPISVEFAEPVQGVGTQIQRVVGGGFTASLKAYDADGTLIADFTANGSSNSNQDGSAIFLGAYEGEPSIKRVEYSVPGDLINLPFAINQLDIARPPLCAILGNDSVLIGGGAQISGSSSNVCSNGALKTAAAARVDASVFAIGDVQLGSGTIVGGDVLANGSITTGVQVQIGEANDPDDLDVDSGGSILLATGSGADGTCEYADTISGNGGCGVESYDPDPPFSEPFLLPTCDATNLLGGMDIKTGAKSDEYTGANALEPGDYGNVVFGSGNQVDLQEGEYTFKTLRFGAETKVKILGPITVRVQDDLRFANGVEMQLEDGEVTPDQVVWFVDGEAEAEAEHRSGAKTVLYGTFCGLGSTVAIGSGSDLTGTIVAQHVEVGPKVNFTFYPAPSVFGGR
jgi:hypothetical protein